MKKVGRYFEILRPSFGGDALVSFEKSLKEANRAFEEYYAETKAWRPEDLLIVETLWLRAGPWTLRAERVRRREQLKLRSKGC